MFACSPFHCEFSFHATYGKPTLDDLTFTAVYPPPSAFVFYVPPIVCQAFQMRKEYPFRVYKLQAGPAQTLFQERFDHHVALQASSTLLSSPFLVFIFLLSFLGLSVSHVHIAMSRHMHIYTTHTTLRRKRSWRIMRPRSSTGS